MDLSIDYMGLKLANPIVAGASPLVDRLDAVRQLEDAGVGAIVMHSLFEEQIETERRMTFDHFDDTSSWNAEASTFMVAADGFKLGPEAYLDQIRKLKRAVEVPIIASLNGTTSGGWLTYATYIEEVGADALELNVYDVVTDPAETSERVEARLVQLLKLVKSTVKIPVAVKLSPFFTALPGLARRLEVAGAGALVIFNRFYQPDIDPERLEVVRIALSSPAELLLRLRWLAVLSSQLSIPLAVTGGVHSGLDVIKAIMAGATTTQMVSALLHNGPRHVATVKDEVVRWMTEHEHDSIRAMCGSMNLARCPDPRAFERANYLKMLQSWPG